MLLAFPPFLFSLLSVPASPPVFFSPLLSSCLPLVLGLGLRLGLGLGPCLGLRLVVVLVGFVLLPPPFLLLLPAPAGGAV